MILVFSSFIYSIIICFIANSYYLIQSVPQSLFLIIPVFLFINFFAGCFLIDTENQPLKVCTHGTTLLTALCISVVTSFVFQVVLAITEIPRDHWQFIGNFILCFCIHAVIFWNGIISVYLTSTQLGIKIRVIGILCSLVPVVNLIVLFFIIKTTAAECEFEAKKEQINKQRQDQEICATKYPILLVHGVFFRDSKHFNYWGRVPKELEANGATIYYGNHHAAATIADSAAELKPRILKILEETGAEKLNIIAHSKGGLDCRYAIAKLGIGDKIASLTTVSTPHRGCLFADYLLSKIPPTFQKTVARAYNSALRKLGESNPDLLAALNDLRESHCEQINKEMPTPEGIYCQSVGSVMGKARGGRFPMNLSYLLVRYFSCENDGLVSESSFKWGEKYTLLRPTERRGISHCDMIDLNRQNFKGFDVREFYVELVSDLREKGF